MARSEVATERARDAGERAAAKPLKGEELERALAQLGLLDRTATLGPWKSFIEGRDHESGSHFIKTAGDDIELSGGTLADQDLIAAARTALPRLLATIRDLLEARKLLRQLVSKSQSRGPAKRGRRQHAR
jgi:hypothetical protein